MQQALTDTQFHEAAVAHMRQHGVTYFAALQSVSVISQHQAGSFNEASFAEPDDLKVHAAAMLYSAQHAVSYSEALDCVATGKPSLNTPLLDPSRIAQVQHTDDTMDAAAKTYARAHGVSYSEALSCVQFEGNANFSEEATALSTPSPAAQALEQQAIEIFRAGSQTDNTGNVYTFTSEDVQSIAAGYSTIKHEAPLTLGHPSDNKPAYGWVKSLQATPDGRLMMYPAQVDPVFAELVKSGKYKKRSASFYPPKHPANPTPGTWYLRHVAWLGAMPPAVRGMPDAAFSAQDSDGFISF